MAFGCGKLQTEKPTKMKAKRRKPRDELGEMPLSCDHFCCVTLGFRMVALPFCYAHNNNFSSGLLAFQSLHRLDYRRIKRK
jgi:hypothetical protein